MQKEGIIELIIVSIIITCMIYFIYNNFYYTKENQKLQQQINNLTYQNQNLNMLCKDQDKGLLNSVDEKGNVIMGLYYGDYIKIWVKNRTVNEIQTTTAHEIGHYLGLVDS